MIASDLFIDFPYVFRHLGILRESVMKGEPLLQLLTEKVKGIRENIQLFSLSEADARIRLPPSLFDERASQQIQNHMLFIEEMKVAEVDLKQQMTILQQMAANDSHVRSEVLIRDCRASSADLYTKSYTFLQPFIDKVRSSGNVFASRIQQFRSVMNVLNQIVNSTPSLKERQRVFSFIHNSFDLFETVAKTTIHLRNQYEQSLDKVTQYETKMRTIIKERQAIRARLDAAYQDKLNSANAVCCPYCHASVPKGETNCSLCGKMLEQLSVYQTYDRFRLDFLVPFLLFDPCFPLELVTRSIAMSS